MRIRLPPHRPGMRIGLYGGTFNPPHLGHRHVALTALRRLRLDRVWWLVTPGNPFKDLAGLASAAERLTAVRALARHPDFAVTTFEADLAAFRTVDTVRFLGRRCPGVRFVWIMGADSMAGFARWRDWREIAGRVPIAVVDRPGFTLRATASKAAAALRPFRVDERLSGTLADKPPPAWCFLSGPRSHLSSTLIRKTGGTGGGGR